MVLNVSVLGGKVFLVWKHMQGSILVREESVLSKFGMCGGGDANDIQVLHSW